MTEEHEEHHIEALYAALKVFKSLNSCNPNYDPVASGPPSYFAGPAGGHKIIQCMGKEGLGAYMTKLEELEKPQMTDYEILSALFEARGWNPRLVGNVRCDPCFHLWVEEPPFGDNCFVFHFDPNGKLATVEYPE